jgi:cytochrome c-type biogenesis protein
MLQILFAILAGILTIGAPCILPLLPILLGSSIGQTSKTRPFFIVLGFVLTFSVVGLLLSYITTHLGLEPQTLRTVAIIMLGLFALFMIWPLPFEKLMLHLGGFINKANQVGNSSGKGNFGGFVLGITLGIIWTPCAGPVLGSILTLIATSTDTARASILLIAYAIGAGIPMLIIAYGSQYISTKVRLLAKYSRVIQQIFGVLILLLAIAMYFQYDLIIQQRLLDRFPNTFNKILNINSGKGL